MLRTFSLAVMLFTLFGLSILGAENESTPIDASVLTKAQKFFERKYPFSPMLLNHKVINSALFNDEISSELFLSAYQYDAIQNRAPESVGRLYGFLTKPFSKLDITANQDRNGILAQLIDFGVELQLPWAYFERGEREKTDTNPFTSWHYLAASRGYEPAKKYVAAGYSKRNYPFFLVKLPPTPKQQIQAFYEEWRGKKYSVALSDLNGFLLKNGIGLYKDLEKEIATLQGDKDDLFEIACTYVRGQNNAMALVYFEHAARLGHFKATRCLWSMLESSAQGQHVPKTLEFARRGAELGDVFSMCRMGDFCLKGFEGQEPDGKQALLYYRAGALQRDPIALSKLATLLTDGGSGLPPNPAEGLRHYLDAADLGIISAMYHAGCLLMDGGIGIEQDRHAALQQFNRAAAFQDVHSIFNAGCIIRDGYKDHPPDKRAALRLFERAAALGDAGGMFNVGCIHLEGYDDQKPNYAKALEYFLAAARAGHVKAMVNGATVARKCFDGHEPDDKQALDLLLEAVRHGDVGSLFNVGCLFHTGFKGQEPNFAMALKYYLMAGERGDAEAYMNAAAIYISGYGGLEPNEEEALQCYIKAARLKNVPAMLQAAHALKTGFKGREPNEQEAFHYILMAAAQGHVDSAFNAGFALVKGTYGQAVNKIRALGLFEQAAAGGDVDSIMNVAVICSNGCEGLEPDGNRALEYFKKAASRGSREGMYHAGLNLLKGFKRRKPDHKAALVYFEQAAENGHVEAMFDTGLMIFKTISGNDFEDGEFRRKLKEPNIQKLWAKALNYLRQAADHGHLQAMLHYAMLLFGFVEDDDQALDYFKRAAAHAEAGSEVYRDAHYHAGDLLLGSHKVKGDLKAALKYLRIAAEYGHLEATYNAACLLRDGFEGQSPDLKEAFRLFTNAAQASHVKAICNKGCMLSKGFEGQEPDEAAALDCYKRSAALGDSLSMHHAGVSLLQFSATRSALKYFEEGAAQKDVRSMGMAGIVWLKGFNGQEPDVNKALSYFKKGAALGDITCCYNAGVTLMGLKDRKSIHQAVSHFTMAAHKGYAPAMMALCKVYLFEFDDLIKAEHWFEIARQTDPSVTRDLEDLALRKLHESGGDGDKGDHVDDMTDTEIDALRDQAITTPGKLESPKLVASRTIRTIYAIMGKREPIHVLSEVAEEETDTFSDVEIQEELSEPLPVIRKKGAQLVRLAKGIDLHNQEEEGESKLTDTSFRILDKIKDKSVDHSDLERLFSDPFFMSQIQIFKTKSGFYISAVNRITKRNGTCGTHRNHGQTFDGFDRKFLGNLWKMLDVVYNIGSKMN
ncbi:MAG: sel1 repeat family protein [Alphaproteobacteria bacterium]|jgi:TPR repeat protein|nr:sel1 repeat family protein [Alphaproteobacteria bacterium]